MYHYAQSMYPKLLVITRFTAFFFFVCVAVSAQQKTAKNSPNSPGILIHNDNFDGVVFPAEKRALDWGAGQEKLQYWTPSESDVMEAEKRLEAFLQALPPKTWGKDPILKNLKNYKRQYVGVITKGKKELFINFLCNESVAEDEKIQKELCEEHHDCTHVKEWTHDIVSVYDGGPCFFSVYYSIASQNFSRLIVNGVA